MIDLMGVLQGLHSLLENKEQNEKKDHAALKKLAAGLVKSKLVGHKDKRIRLLCACCLADIIRVLAPQHPFSDAQLKVWSVHAREFVFEPYALCTRV